MATAVLLPITNWHGLLPAGTPVSADAGGDINGLNGFWVVESAVTAHWTTTGDTDFGACLQTASDGKTVNAQKGPGDGISGNAAPLVFADTGAIPVGAVIESVQLTVTATIAHANMASSCQVLAGAAGVDSGAFDLVGASSTDFTGTGTYSSAVMTVTPGLGVAWARADLFGDPLTYFTGNPRGWWSPGTAANVVGVGSSTASSFVLDYVALTVVYHADAIADNTNASPPFQTPGQWAIHRLDLQPRKEGPRG